MRRAPASVRQRDLRDLIRPFYLILKNKRVDMEECEKNYCKRISIFWGRCLRSDRCARRLHDKWREWRRKNDMKRHASSLDGQPSASKWAKKLSWSPLSLWRASTAKRPPWSLPHLQEICDEMGGPKARGRWWYNQRYSFVEMYRSPTWCTRLK